MLTGLLDYLFDVCHLLRSSIGYPYLTRTDNIDIEDERSPMNRATVTEVQRFEPRALQPRGTT